MYSLRLVHPALFATLALALAACGQQAAPTPGSVAVRAQNDSISLRTYSGVAFSDVATDQSGNVVVVGTSRTEPTLAKYDASGQNLWTHAFISQAGVIDSVGRAVAVDTGGNAYAVGETDREALSGQSRLVKVSPSGQVLWRKDAPQSRGLQVPFADLALDGAGNVYSVGWQFDDATGGGNALTKFTPQGSVIWENALGSEAVLKVAAEPQGRSFVEASGAQVTLTKYEANHFLIGTKRWGEGSRNAPVSIVASQYGSIYSLWTSPDANITRLNKYDANYVWRWSVVVPQGAVDVTLDAYGNLYIVGNTDGGAAFVEKYEPERGARQWRKTFDDGAASATGVAVTAQGEVIVVGGQAFAAMDPTQEPNTGYIARLR